MLLAAPCLLVAPRPASAHELDTASLSVTEVDAGRFVVRFRASSPTLQRELKVPARFPEHCRLRGTELDCGSPGLVGSIELPWLEGTPVRVATDIHWQNGYRLLRVVSASSPSLRVYGGAESRGLRALRAIGFDYLRFGVEHILTGYDHLLFLAALVFLVRSLAALLATITAFTLAHSLTLAATALGYLSLPAAPVEAAIALSIVLVASECLRPHDSLVRKFPWLVAFVFGLLHGLGFAGALLEIGLPERHLALALFCFNLGVELGQLAAIAGIGLLRMIAGRFATDRRRLGRGLLYAIGGVAAFWSIERVCAVFGL
jgi:hydrogenase/urease accessory protein HupE